MSRKIGFWSVFAIVTGSQIGTGIFMLPASLAGYGMYSFVGWLISGVGAIALCQVFAYLCSRFPQTGGPHAFINNVFGPHAAFFTGWTYWVISWVSTTAVVITAIASLSPFLGNVGQEVYLFLQILLLSTIALLNLKGVQAAGKVEFILILMKFIPLLIIPIVAISSFDGSNFTMSQEVSELPTSSILSQVTFLTLWGFIGIETATAPVGEVKNPSSIVPRAIIIGTLCVVALYLLNSIGIMGVMSGAELANSKAPYVDVSRRIFGGNWYLAISLMTSIVCVGTLNAWVLSTGQVMLGLAQDGLVPKILARKNRSGAPVFGIILSSIGIVPFLFLTANDDFASQINEIIDISVTAFLFVYLFCCLAFIRLIIREGNISLYRLLYGSVAMIFCIWVIYETSLDTILIACSFVASAIPLYLIWFRKRY